MVSALPALIIGFLVVFFFWALILQRASRPPSRQFTIRGMMLFILLWAVCLSQLSCLSVKRSGPNPVWQHDWVVPFAWIVLAIFYWRARQFGVLFCHSTGILYVGYLFGMAFTFEGWTQGERKVIELALGIGMIFGSFFGLVFFSLVTILA
ncbi:MAG: hypothetical protein WAU84_06665, partial [Thermoguttaceae bacterium]